MKIDLHCHTNCSDGSLTPLELVQRAENMGVHVLAITDHDSTAALMPARKAIIDNKLKLRLISGVEVSSQWANYGIHVVGLNIDPEVPDFSEFLQQQHKVREQRATVIADKLERTGFAGVGEQTRRLATGAEITRAHFARALVQFHGLASMEQAFRRYLGKGNIGDVKAQWPQMEQAIEMIHRANGQAVLAHPLKYNLSTKWIRRLISDFKTFGGDAVEVSGPGVTGDKQRLLHDIVSKHELCGSTASDFHSPGRWTELGKFQTILSPVKPIWHDWGL